MSSNKMDYEYKKDSGKNLFRIVCIIVVFFLVLFLLIVLMTKQSRNPPRIFGYGFTINSVNSADGLTESESLLVTKKIKPSQLKAGDLIAYTEGFNEYQNPIIKVNKVFELTSNKTSYSVKTNDPQGQEVDESLIIGKVQASVHWLGKFCLFVKTPLGLIVCVAIPLLFLLIAEIVNLIRLSQNEKNEEQVLNGNLASYMKINEEEPVHIPAIKYENDSENKTIGKEYLFEQQNEELEVVESRSPFTSISYKKSDITRNDIKNNEIYSTKEFDVPNGVAKSAVISSHKEESVMQPQTQSSNDFFASIGADTTNCFDIEGIAVKVESDAVNLKVNKNSQNHDIAITVTNDYTNVIFDTDKNEVNFAFIKDEADNERKVIIQKKNKV